MRSGSAPVDISDQSLYGESLRRLEEWMVRNDFKGYDPFDGLSSYLRVFTLRKRFPQQALLQFVRRNPLNLRPLIGIKPHTSTKGMAFVGGGYVKLFVKTGDERYKQRAVNCFQWLIDHASPGYSGACWGNDFDYIARGFYLPRHAPTIVWSGLIGHFFIEAYRALREPRFLDVAKSIGTFILNDVPLVPVSTGACISYVCHKKEAVHNANLLGARFLAELFKETGTEKYASLAREAVRYSAAAQLPNGAWWYGEEEKYHWIDNWHTAYNLDSILEYQVNTGNREFEPQLLKGLEFYTAHFFREDGAPRYYWDRDYKFDIQSSSQSIDTLLLFGARLRRPELKALARKVARWTIMNMQDSSGYFYLWKNSWFTNKTPTFHWGAGTMFHALAHLQLEGDPE